MDYERWRNFNAFEARLLRDHVCDCSLHALWAFRDAFEIAGREHWIEAHLLHVALDWLTLAPMQLLRDDNWGESAKAGALWRGEGGLSVARWSFWRNQLKICKDNESLDVQKRKRAGLAAEAIDLFMIENGE